jgi:hypothetical protein
MNRSQVQDAMESRKPFVIRTADGREFTVPTRDHIAMSPNGTFVQVFGDDDSVTSIPLIMMASVRYEPAHATEGE